MFENAQQFIDYVTLRFGSKRTNQRNFKECMISLGNPQLDLKCFHVAGTNGKGSTTNYLRSVLQTAGYKVGSFTSPHLVVHNDRIRINDVNIPDEVLLTYANRFVEVWEKYDLSMFEIDALISFFYFLEEKVDFVIYEVGMGGRLDATNVIMPLVSMITNIGYDHMNFLGNTYEAIAIEKAGIIKRGIPLFTTENKEECLQVFQEKCEEYHSSFAVIRKPEAILNQGNYHYCYKQYRVRLNTCAPYQIKNSVLALTVLDYLKEMNVIQVTNEEMEKGLFLAMWKGRFELVSQNPNMILDGAHNEEGVQALIEGVENLKKPIVIIFTALKDKEYRKMIESLNSVTKNLILTEFDFYRSASLEELGKGFDLLGIQKYQDAIKYAEKIVGNGTIIITGSLYFISDVRAYLKGE